MQAVYDGLSPGGGSVDPSGPSMAVQHGLARPVTKEDLLSVQRAASKAAARRQGSLAPEGQEGMASEAPSAPEAPRATVASHESDVIIHLL